MNLYGPELSEKDLKSQYGSRWRTFCLDFDIWNIPKPFCKKVTFNWQCVKFEKSSKNQVPSERGIYYFLIEPSYGLNLVEEQKYILYVGQARNLNRRYQDYFHYRKSKKPSEQLKRNMVVIWEDVLFFKFLETPNLSDKELTDLEYEVIDTIVPPFNKDFRASRVKERLALTSRK